MTGFPFSRFFSVGRVGNSNALNSKTYNLSVTTRLTRYGNKGKIEKVQGSVQPETYVIVSLYQHVYIWLADTNKINK